MDSYIYYKRQGLILKQHRWGPWGWARVYTHTLALLISNTCKNEKLVESNDALRAPHCESVT